MTDETKAKLSQSEIRILEGMTKEFRTGREIAEDCGVDYNSLMSALGQLEAQGLIEVRREEKKTLQLSAEGEEFAKNGTPEARLYGAVSASGGTIGMDDAYSKARLSQAQRGVALQWAKRNGWVEIAKDADGKVAFKEAKKVSQKELKAVADALNAIAGQKTADKKALADAIARKLVVEKAEKEVSAKATGAAANAISQAKREQEKVISVITPEMLRTKSWKREGVRFEEYDALAPTPTVYMGKKQPLRAFIDELRDVFIEMGFEEIKGPIVEASFWNFDALFVPQDHPGREVQDTFYIKSPHDSKLPEQKFVEGVRASHENGGSTGSTGWKYKWDPKVAMGNVLRTHTTAATCRQLAKAAKAGKFPVKVFCIDRVYRNEAIDYKHLAEFHQVEGIIIDDNCTFQDLLGTLKIFYKKLGFADVRITPSYFPYTEPSAQVEAYNEAKGEWLELGGCGMFRPEVTRPLGITQNVAAWGLGLERPIMLREKLGDIRTFYRNDLDWIRKEKKEKDG